MKKILKTKSNIGNISFAETTHSRFTVSEIFSKKGHFLKILACGLFLIVALASCGHDEPAYNPGSEDNDSNVSLIPELNFESAQTLLNEVNVDELSAEGVSLLPSDFEIEDTENLCNWPYRVILPPSYEDSPEKYYPIVYLLHGYGSTYSDWTTGGRVKITYDFLLTQKDLREMIIVMPEASTSYYTDGYEMGINYETFFIKQFIPEIESKFRIIKEKNHRMIMGCSMGGYGAAYYSFKYPELFGYCYAMSAALDGRGVKTTPAVEQFFDREDVNEYPFITLDIGTKDNNFLSINQRYHSKMNSLGISHEFIVRDGDHSWKFWREGCYVGLQRISKFIEWREAQEGLREQL